MIVTVISITQLITVLSLIILSLSNHTNAILLFKRTGVERPNGQRASNANHQNVNQNLPDLNTNPSIAQNQRLASNGQHNSHSHVHYDSQEVRKDFRDFHAKEKNNVKGVVNLSIKGDPNSNHLTPKTTFSEGKKGGKIVEAFLREPSPTNLNDHRSNSVAPGTICVVIGECKFSNSNLPTDGRYRAQGIMRHTNVHLPGIGQQMDNNIISAETRGFKYRKTSSHTLTNSPNAILDHPELQIHPGKESGQYFSLLYRPNSPPPHISSPRRASTPPRASSPSSSSDGQVGHERKHGE